MNVTSIARQNRRKRLSQYSDIPMKSLPGLHNLSVSEATSGYKSTENVDTNLKEHAIEQRSNSTDTKSNDTTEWEPFTSHSFSTDCSFVNNDVSSQPVDKMFIEGEKRFREINASQIFHLTRAEISIQPASKNELISIALQINKYFHSASNFCHGLLGGMSLLYLFILLHLFSHLSVDEDTIKYFSFFSKPVHNVFNLLCIICCVSSFDRFDISNTEELCKLVKKLDFRLITLIIYPICLLLSFTTANMDDMLSLSIKNETMWESNFKEEADLYYWKTLSISKCFGALLAWMVICWDQNFNIFLNHLKNIQHKRKILH